MYRKLEIDPGLCIRSNHILAKSLEGGKQLTREALRQELVRHNIMADGQRLAYLVMQAELDGVICSGARLGNQFTYALLEERVPPTRTIHIDEALAELTKRYFISRGPATLHDFAYWSGLTLSAATQGYQMNKPQLLEEIINGVTYIYSPAEITHTDNRQVTFLMPVYDEYGISYKNRRNLIYPADESFAGIVFDRLIIQQGRIAGSWNRTIQNEKVNIQLQLTNPVEKNLHPDIMDAVEKYGKFLGKKVVLM